MNEHTSNREADNVITAVVLAFMIPFGAISAGISLLWEQAKAWFISTGILLPTLPQTAEESNNQATTHALVSNPDLGIALDAPRVIFLLCILLLLLIFADYMGKVKRARRARRR